MQTNKDRNTRGTPTNNPLKAQHLFVSKRILDATMTPLLRSLINQKVENTFNQKFRVEMIATVNKEIEKYLKKKEACGEKIPAHVEPMLAMLQTAKTLLSEGRYCEFYEFYRKNLEAEKNGIKEKLESALSHPAAVILGQFADVYGLPMD